MNENQTPAETVKKILRLIETTKLTCAQISKQTGVCLNTVHTIYKAGLAFYYKRQKKELIERDANWLRNLRLRRVRRHRCPNCGELITLTPCLACAVRKRKQKIDRYDFTGESITFSAVDENDFTGDTIQIKAEEFLDNCQNIQKENNEMALYISAEMLADNYRELYKDDPVVAAVELRTSMRHYLQNEPDPGDITALDQLAGRVNRDAIALSNCAKRLRSIHKDLVFQLDKCRTAAEQEDNHQ